MGEEKRLQTTYMVNTRKKRGTAAYRKGLWAEFLCAVVLTVKGYRLVAKRYNTAQGEIDIIALHGNNIVFVEVKARPSLAKAGEAISSQQKTRLKRAASAYLSGRSTLSHCSQRFDVMLVLPWSLPVHHVNAF